jgi:hypothetical protein
MYALHIKHLELNVPPLDLLFCSLVLVYQLRRDVQAITAPRYGPKDATARPHWDQVTASLAQRCPGTCSCHERSPVQPLSRLYYLSFSYSYSYLQLEVMFKSNYGWFIYFLLIKAESPKICKLD